MRARWMRFVLATGIAGAIAVTGLGTGLAAVISPARNHPAGSGAGSVLWTSVEPGGGQAIAADPDGSMVFAVGKTFLTGYDAATGAQVWDNRQGNGVALAVSPDGRAVFVIKAVHGTLGASFSTSAYDASTGSLLWSSLYHGKTHGADRPTALAVSPGGGTVFVTGWSQGKISGIDYATVAYAAASGRQLWASRYTPPIHGRNKPNGQDYPMAIAVSPSGAAVFVTGQSYLPAFAGQAYSTVAYAAATGGPLWTRRYDLPRHDDMGGPTAVTVSHDGKRVFVASTQIRLGGINSVTIAYAASSGRQLWLQRDNTMWPVDVLVSPRGGGTVLEAGDFKGNAAVIAYSAATGQLKWVSRIEADNFRHESPGEMVLNPDGGTFYLAGTGHAKGKPGASFTFAGSVATGKQTWSHAVSTGAPSSSRGLPVGLVAVSQDGGTVYMGAEGYTTAPPTFSTIALHA